MDNNVMQEIKESLAKQLEISLELLESVIGNRVDEHDMTNSNDCKISMSQAVRANRILSRWKAELKGRRTSWEVMAERYTNEAENTINTYIREINAGNLPLEDKEIVLADFERYKIALGDTESIVAGCKTDKERKDTLSSMLSTWRIFHARKVTSPDQIVFTTVNINETVVMPLDKPTPTSVKAMARTVGSKKADAALQRANAKYDVVSELLNGVSRDITALGSIIDLVTSEQYAIRKTSRVD